MYAWQRAFESGGAVVDSLQLALGVGDEPYAWGQNVCLLLGMRNHAKNKREFEQVHGCGKIGRADG